MDTVKLGEEVYMDATGTFKVVYGGIQGRAEHGFVTYTKFRTHWKRINRTSTYQLAMDCLTDYKERLGL